MLAGIASRNKSTSVFRFTAVLISSMMGSMDLTVKTFRLQPVRNSARKTTILDPGIILEAMNPPVRKQTFICLSIEHVMPIE
jgi:hypothetical protein